MKTSKLRHCLLKKVAVFILATFLYQIFFSSIAFALTDGPTQPEFSKFEPVGTTNMVNEFTGDFTYNLPVLNIPGPNGGGYSLSLSYHSGTSPEEEASWVGYGWTLNPGAIIRNKRGFPDDWNGKKVTYWNRMPKNQTIAIGPDIGFEAFSFGGFSANATLRYNNYKGFGYTLGIGLRDGIGSLGYNITDGEGSFSLAINPAATLSKMLTLSNEDENSNVNIAARGLNILAKKGFANIPFAGSNYGILTYSSINRPTQISEYQGESFYLDLSVMGTPSGLQMSGYGGLGGSYSWQENYPKDILNAFGYMYSSNTKNPDKDMMDYYIEKGVVHPIFWTQN